MNMMLRMVQLFDNVSSIMTVFHFLGYFYCHIVTFNPVHAFQCNNLCNFFVFFLSRVRTEWRSYEFQKKTTNTKDMIIRRQPRFETQFAEVLHLIRCTATCTVQGTSELTWRDIWRCDFQHLSVGGRGTRGLCVSSDKWRSAKIRTPQNRCDIYAHNHATSDYCISYSIDAFY